MLHDLRIPIPGIKANIDHVVISGRRVLLIDTKVWKPGIYWTFAGATRRGVERFTPADKRTMPMAADAIRRHLDGFDARLLAPLVTVWPSRLAPMSLLFARSPGSRLVLGNGLLPAVHRCLGPVNAAEPALMARMRQLVIR